eukprot:5158493-Amphidinium_carterae.1
MGAATGAPDRSAPGASVLADAGQRREPVLPGSCDEKTKENANGATIRGRTSELSLRQSCGLRFFSWSFGRYLDTRLACGPTNLQRWQTLFAKSAQRTQVASGSSGP